MAFSCEKFLNTIVCNRKYCRMGAWPPVPLDLPLIPKASRINVKKIILLLCLKQLQKFKLLCKNTYITLLTTSYYSKSTLRAPPQNSAISSSEVLIASTTLRFSYKQSVIVEL